MVQYESKSGRGEPVLWTWQSIREWMASKYGGSHTEYDLHQMELKWRKIFAAAGFSVKGQ